MRINLGIKTVPQLEKCHKEIHVDYFFSQKCLHSSFPACSRMDNNDYRYIGRKRKMKIIKGKVVRTLICLNIFLVHTRDVHV